MDVNRDRTGTTDAKNLKTELEHHPEKWEPSSTPTNFVFVKNKHLYNKSERIFEIITFCSFAHIFRILHIVYTCVTVYNRHFGY